MSERYYQPIEEGMSMMRTRGCWCAVILVAVGCSDPVSPEQQARAALDAAGIQSDGQVQVSVSKDGTVIMDGSGFAPVDPADPVAQVGLKDDQALVAAAATPVVKRSKSTDVNGNPKTIYVFNREAVGAQLELSPSQALIGWTVYSDSPDARKNSEANVKVAQRLARAALGLEGGRLVDQVTAGKRFKQITVAGHVVSSAMCAGTMCAMTIARSF